MVSSNPRHHLVNQERVALLLFGQREDRFPRSSLGRSLDQMNRNHFLVRNVSPRETFQCGACGCRLFNSDVFGFEAMEVPDCVRDPPAEVELDRRR